MFDRFRELIAEYIGTDKSNVYPFTGADSALRTIFFMSTKPGDKVLYINPTFAMIRIYSENRGLISTTVDSFEDNDWWKVDIDMLIKKSRNVDLAVIVDPNNPTGGPIAKADKHIIERLSENVSGYVVFDETYFEYANYTVVSYIDEYPNLVIIRSLSKSFCLAGFRLGYIVAQKDVVDKLSSIHTPFDIPTPSLIAGITALENRRYMEHIVAEVKRLREEMFRDLRSIDVKAYRSYTNFLLIKDSRNIDEILLKHNIYIKKIDKNLYRLTIPPSSSICKKIINLLAENI